MRRLVGMLGLVGSLLVAGVLLVAVSVLVGWQVDAERGSYADWLGAVSTLAAVLAAVYAGVQGAQALRIERDRDEERAQDAKMAQAKQVALWAPGPVEWQGPMVIHSWVGNGPTTTVVRDEPVMPTGMQVQARNASGLPVFNLTADFYMRATWDSEWVLAVECPVCPFLLEDQPSLEVFTPGLSEEAGRVVNLLPGEWDGETVPDFAVGWSFVDAGGLRWTRGPGMPLTQVVHS